MDLKYLPRWEPVQTLKLWRGLVLWEDSWFRNTEEWVALADHPPAELTRDFVGAGCPRAVLRKAFLPGKAGTPKPARVRAVMETLEEHLARPPHWCLEVVANLNATDDSQLLLLADYDLKRLGDPYEVRGDGGRDEAVPVWQVERLRTGVRVIQNVALQMASGNGAVTLRGEEADHLRRLARIHGRRRRDDEVPLYEIQERHRQVLGMVVLGAASNEEHTVRGAWVDGIDEPYEPLFDGNWILASAAAFLVDVGLRVDRRHVKRCSLPVGKMAYLDELLGKRADPTPVCGTIYVAERADARCCERERCKQMQKLINKPDDLQEALHDRKQYHAELGDWKRLPARRP